MTRAPTEPPSAAQPPRPRSRGELARAAWPAALVVAAVAVQFAPVLVGRVYRFEDIASYFEPLWAAAGRAMRAGRLPLWDGGAWGGQPLAGDPQLGLYYPLNWLWCVLPTLRAYAVVVALHGLLGGLGMYTLARVRGASREGAALAGVALGVGGYLVLQVRHVMFVEATAWMPWVLAAGWRLCERRRGRDVAAMAAAGGMLLLTGGVSMIYYGLWLLAAVLLPRVLAKGPQAATSTPAGTGGEAGTSSGTGRAAGDLLAAMQQGRWGALALLALAGGLALALAAPSILPAAAHGRLSPRALGADEEFAASVAWRGIWLLPSLFLPNLLGQQVTGDYRGGGTQWEIAGYYTGMVTFALAVFALARGRAERRGERLAVGGVMALAVLLAPGAHSPLHHLACKVLPLYSTMRCPPRALWVVAIGAPMLAADGLDLVKARLAGRHLLQRTIPVLLPLLVAVDLLVTHRAENPTTTLAAARQAATPAAVGWLREHLRPGERYINDVHLDHALHNSGLLWGLPAAGGYSSLPLWRYLHLLWISNHGREYPFDKLHDDLSAQGIWRFDSPIVDLLAIRYVLAPPGWQPHAAGFVKRFDGGDGIDVWENGEAEPFTDFAPAGHLRVGAVASAAMAALVAKQASEPQPPGERLLDLERLPRIAGWPAHPDQAGKLGPEGSARLARMAETEIEVEVTAAVAGAAFLSLPYHPDWRATVDGLPAEVVAADYALSAVVVAPGRHTVALRFTAPAVERGLALAAAALLCIAAFVVGGAVTGRRGR